jgi:hypothetical protein
MRFGSSPGNREAPELMNEILMAHRKVVGDRSWEIPRLGKDRDKLVDLFRTDLGIK